MENVTKWWQSKLEKDNRIVKSYHPPEFVEDRRRTHEGLNREQLEARLEKANKALAYLLVAKLESHYIYVHKVFLQDYEGIASDFRAPYLKGVEDAYNAYNSEFNDIPYEPHPIEEIIDIAHQYNAFLQTDVKVLENMLGINGPRPFLVKSEGEAKVIPIR